MLCTFRMLSVNFISSSVQLCETCAADRVHANLVSLCLLSKTADLVPKVEEPGLTMKDLQIFVDKRIAKEVK